MLGIFITFEGIEGCGKSTQIKLLDRFLLKQGYKTVLTREPGGTLIGDKIRDILLDAKNNDMHPLAEILLYAASRAQHVEGVIKPALAKGRIVLCDRYIDSSTAYQGAARRLNLGTVERLNMIATGGLKPDLTIVLDVDPKEGLARAGRRGTPDRFEREAIAFHKNVRAGYLALAKKEPRRVKVINGTLKIEEAHEEVLKVVNKILNPKP